MINISWFITKNVLLNVLSSLYKRKKTNPSGLLVIIIFVVAVGFTVGEIYVKNINYESQAILDNVKKSPYMALYAKGSFFTGTQFKEEETHYLNFWKNLKVFQVPQLVKLMPHQKNAYVFKKVIPFREVLLIIQRSDKQHLIYEKGISIYFDGPYKDEELVNEIQKEVHTKKSIINLVDSFPIIIVSKEALKDKYEFDPKHPPFCLYIRGFKKKAEIPLRLIVADCLPYNYSYVISYKEHQKIKTDYYYKKISNFNIILINENEFSIVEYLLKNQILTGKIKEITHFIKGDKPALNIELYKEEYRFSLLKQLFSNKSLLEKIRAIDLGASVEEETHSYNGLILYPDHKFLKKECMFAIYKLLAQNGIAVGSELLYSLTNAQELRSIFESLDRSLKYGVVWITIMIALLMWIFLYTQIYTIGIYKMYGMSDLEIIFIYIFIYLICIFVGILTGSLIYSLISLFCKISPSAIRDGALISLIYLLIPLIVIIIVIRFFIKSQTPADMISYKG